jgi:hypothetical protein
MSVSVPKLELELVMLRCLHDRGLIHQGGEGSTRSTTATTFHRGTTYGMLDST